MTSTSACRVSPKDGDLWECLGKINVDIVLNQISMITIKTMYLYWEGVQSYIVIGSFQIDLDDVWTKNILSRSK